MLLFSGWNTQLMISHSIGLLMTLIHDPAATAHRRAVPSSDTDRITSFDNDQTKSTKKKQCIWHMYKGACALSHVSHTRTRKKKQGWFRLKTDHWKHQQAHAVVNLFHHYADRQDHGLPCWGGQIYSKQITSSFDMSEVQSEHSPHHDDVAL